MTDDLDSKSDDELDDLFAVEVASYRRLRYCSPGRAYLIPPIVASYFLERGDTSWQEAEPSDETVWFSDVFKEYAHFKEPRFTIDANAVLPYLNLWRWDANWHPQYQSVVMTLKPTLHHPKDANVTVVEAPTLARAAVIALIRAKCAQATTS